MRITTILKDYKIKDSLFLLFIMISILPVFNWLPNPSHQIIAGIDNFPYINAKQMLKNGAYVWSGEYGGIYYPLAPLRAVYAVPYYIIHIFGLSIGWAQLLIYYFYSFLGTAGIYLFCRQILKTKPLTSLFSSFLYLLTPFSLMLFKNGWIAQLLTFSFLPWILLFLYKWIVHEDFKYLFISITILLLCSPVAVNLPSYLALLGFIFFYVILWQYLYQWNIGKIIKKISFFCILTLLTNLWWIILIPYYISLSTDISFDIKPLIWSSSNYTTILNLFRFLAGRELIGETALKLSPWASIYNTIPLNILLLVPIGIVSLYIMKSSSHNFQHSIFRKKFFLLANFLAALILIFLIKRYNPPFADFTLWLYEKIPYLWAFRSAHVKFTPFVVFIMCILFGTSLDNLEGRVKAFFLFLCGIVLIMCSIPYYTGEVVRVTGIYKRNMSHVIDFPEENYKFIDFFYEKMIDRQNVIILPPYSWYQTWYSFGLHSVDMHHYLIPYSDVYYVLPHKGSWSYGAYIFKPRGIMRFTSKIFYWNLLHNRSIPKEAFKLLGINTIVYREDLLLKQPQNPISIKKLPYKEIISYLGFKEIAHLGHIRIYKTNSDISKFYVSEQVIFRRMSDVWDIITNGFLKYLNVKEKSTHCENSLIAYKKYNPTHYKLKLETKSACFLVFAQAYDKFWRAKIYKNNKLVEISNSIPLYSLVNGFDINSTGNLTVEIEYLPQKWFGIGLFVSLFTIVGLVLNLCKFHFTLFSCKVAN